MKLLLSGYQLFKTRVKEVLDATADVNLDDVLDDEHLHAYYRNGDSAEFVAASLWNPALEED
ncbi:MAG: hypothetical protein HUK20_02705 [Fibrobacter sp.]|nr:hypothetical protein [Fibrobacter sp.]